MIHEGRWRVKAFRNEADTFVVQVGFAADEFIHDGKVHDGVAVSFSTDSEGMVLVEILGTSEGRVLTPVSLAPYLEMDDMVLVAAKALAREVVLDAAA